MNKRLSLAFGVILSLLNTQAFAIGLGNLHLGSSYNQPLHAQLEVFSPHPYDADVKQSRVSRAPV